VVSFGWAIFMGAFIGTNIGPYDETRLARECKAKVGFSFVVGICPAQRN
jgi:hypothetical protein